MPTNTPKILTAKQLDDIRFDWAVSEAGVENSAKHIPALLLHIECQKEALEQAWYVLDAVAGGAPKTAALMARSHIEKIIGSRESNFE